MLSWLSIRDAEIVHGSLTFLNNSELFDKVSDVSNVSKVGEVGVGGGGYGRLGRKGRTRTWGMYLRLGELGWLKVRAVGDGGG